MRRRVLTKARLGMMAAVALIALFVAACGGSSNGGSSTGNAGSATAKAGGVLHQAVASEPPSLVPSTALETSAIEVVAQISEPLLKLTESGKIEPLLATSYKHSADGLTWTFNLREGVKFSDGKPMTAKDVVFSLEAERNSEFFAGLFEQVTSIKELSPNQVQIKVKEPLAALPASLTIPSSGIAPDNYGGVSEKEFSEKPIGTGPYMLKKWVHGQSLTLVKNPNYWQSDQPRADEVVLTIVEDEKSRVAQLRGGDVDFMHSTSFPQLESLEQTPGVVVSNYGMYRFDYVGLNLNEPLFANRKAREAVNLAIDREGVNKAALAGLGEPAGSFLPPTLPYHTEIPVQSQELAKAKQLLGEAEKEGVSPSFNLSILAGEAYAETAGQVIQQNLNEAGFKVTLQPLDLAALYEKYNAGETEATLAGFYSSIPDPSELTPFYLSVEAKTNGVDTKHVEQLTAEAATELNTEKRQALYTEIQEEVQAELQAVPVDYQPQIWLSHDNIAGLEVNSVGTPWLNKTGFTE